MQIREPSAQDLDALLAFFARVPESERTFFKEAVLDRATVEGWLTPIAAVARSRTTTTAPSSATPP